ncbi:hypothetical protein FF36_05994 [Frankia torreyi]|uniref:Uncharacterized protein n=1 Tax=Frankia torreyi TaxID=1856 RepID=A0A0D8B745_9ACTN|nr:hypothetical protein [Frankia torreyi]KJE19739.1 hypothetical protein FF36_05994 [Frankia torreyi]
MASRTLSAVAGAAAQIRTELRARPGALSGAAISVTSDRASLLRIVRVRVDQTGATPEDTRAMARDVWTVVRRHWRGGSEVIVNGRYLGERY